MSPGQTHMDTGNHTNCRQAAAKVTIQSLACQVAVPLSCPSNSTSILALFASISIQYGISLGCNYEALAGSCLKIDYVLGLKL